MKQDIDIKLVETFVYDCERLFLLNFDNTEYEINQTCLTVRKLLIDTPGIMRFWNFFCQDKFRIISSTSVDKFSRQYIESLKLYIPLLDILPDVVVINYTSIKLKEKPHSCTVQSPEIKIEFLSIDKYLSEDFIVIDKNYITRKDILDFVAYGLGAIHYNARPDKQERIKTVEKLNFNYAMGNDSPDSAFFFIQSFRSKEDEDRSKDNPDFFKFMMTLGDRHSFESLMILQIAHEIRATDRFIFLYFKAKEYLIQNMFKYKDYDINNNFTLVERSKNIS